MADRYLVVSDLHLCDVEEHADGWRYYKSARYGFDGPFSELLSWFQRGVAGPGARRGRDTLVLNGDIFDFDLVSALPSEPPWPVSWFERRYGLNPTPEKSAWKLRLVLEHHPLFVEALASFIAGGGRVVYVLGNHDRELHFAAVRQVLVEAIGEALHRLGHAWDGEGLEFEPWFFHVPGALYVEHGNQYDAFSSYRDVLRPAFTVRGEEEMLSLPMGNLSNRCLLGRMGSFNPFSDDYLRTGAGYIRHWLRHGSVSRGGLFRDWLSGSVVVMATMLRRRRLEDREPAPVGDDEHLERLARQRRLSPDQIRMLLALQCPPVSTRRFAALRKLWLDRLLFGAVAALGTAGLAATATPLWVRLGAPAFIIPLLYALYERVAGEEPEPEELQHITDRAEVIARLLGVPLVVFGHDHKPRQVTLPSGSTFVDCGAWAPITDDVARALVPGFRNFLELMVDRGVKARFDTWSEAAPPWAEASSESRGELVADPSPGPEHARPPAPPAGSGDRTSAES